MNSGMPTPAEGLQWNMMVDDAVLDSSRPQVESDGTITSRAAPKGAEPGLDVRGGPGPEPSAPTHL